MATLNELGRNSAAIQYGPFATGQDLFPTLQAVDTWLRNDTWQGYATASGTTLTGVGTIWTTQARAGDYILVAGQQRIVASVVSDTSITVTVAFSPAITVASAVKVINSVQPSVSGTIAYTARGTTNGVVSVTNGSSTISGVGTYFTSDLTNTTTTVTLAGTVAIDTSGSLSTDNLVDIFKEIRHLSQQVGEITILECDAEVHRVYRYQYKQSITVEGRGGTDFNPVIEYYNTHAVRFDCLIFFTDGYVPQPTIKPLKPSLFVINNSKHDLKKSYNLYITEFN